MGNECTGRHFSSVSGLAAVHPRWGGLAVECGGLRWRSMLLGGGGGCVGKMCASTSRVAVDTVLRADSMRINTILWTVFNVVDESCRAEGCARPSTSSPRPRRPGRRTDASRLPRELVLQSTELWAKQAKNGVVIFIDSQAALKIPSVKLTSTKVCPSL